MQRVKFFLPLIFCFTLIAFVHEEMVAQEEKPPFWNEIQKFKQQDQEHPPEEGQIVFVGSSSFAKWQNVNEYFPKYKIINRGFGGSTLPDVIRYADAIIFPYKPRQIVIYAGDNDAAESDTISASQIFYRFKKLYQQIREKLPETEVTYISIKPSPSREQFFPVMNKANWEIREYLEKQDHAEFIDIWHKMLDDFGKPREELFGSDRLHMNKEGYKIWQKAIQPYLIN